MQTVFYYLVAIIISINIHKWRMHFINENLIDNKGNCMIILKHAM